MEGHPIGEIVLLRRCGAQPPAHRRKVRPRRLSRWRKTRAARIASEPPPAQRSSARSIALGVFDRRAVADEAVKQQFADEAARHDRALVDIEPHALDIGAIEQIGGRLARRDPRVDQRDEPRALGAGETGVEERIERVDRQLQPFEDDEGRFVDRVGRAMTIGKLGGVEAADGVAEEIANGDEDGEPFVVAGYGGKVNHALGRRRSDALRLGTSAGVAGRRNISSYPRATHCAFMHPW